MPHRLQFVGSERHGVGGRWKAAADEAVRIPMSAGVDSLNVTVAAGIVLFEAARRRHAGAGGARLVSRDACVATPVVDERVGGRARFRADDLADEERMVAGLALAPEAAFEPAECSLQ